VRLPPSHQAVRQGVVFVHKQPDNLPRRGGCYWTSPSAKTRVWSLCRPTFLQPYLEVSWPIVGSDEHGLSSKHPASSAAANATAANANARG
jgi:hypothetical protein